MNLIFFEYLREILAAKGGTTQARNGRWILPENARLPRNIQGSFTCLNLRRGIDSFTSPPKEGVLRIFPPWKIQRLRSGPNPRTWVPKASTQPLDHRSRWVLVLVLITRLLPVSLYIGKSCVWHIVTDSNKLRPKNCEWLQTILVTCARSKFRQNPSSTSQLEMFGLPQKVQHLTTNIFIHFLSIVKKTRIQEIFNAYSTGRWLNRC